MKRKFLYILLVILIGLSSTSCAPPTAPPIPPTATPIPPNKFDPITISRLRTTVDKKAYYVITGTLKDSSGSRLPNEYLTISVIAYRKTGGSTSPKILTEYNINATTDSSGDFNITVYVPTNKERISSNWSTEYHYNVDIELHGPRVMKTFKGK